MQRLAAAACVVALVALWTTAGARAAAAPRADDDKRSFTLAEVLDGSYSAKGLGGVWVSENEIARRNSRGAIEILNVDNNRTTDLITSDKLASRNRNVGTWTLSRDRSKLLWSYDVKAGFRHSTEAVYAVYHLNSQTWKNLHEGKHLQIAMLAPQGNGVTYVYENNIYYVANIFESEAIIAITTDGSDVIYNGVPDWVYEEEVLSSGSAMWFSPDGSHLVHAKFDDAKVKQFTYITYGTEVYTNLETLRYPKPGSDNPTVSLFVTKVPEKITKTLPSPDPAMEILQNVAWAGNEKVLVTWLNRIQNSVTISSYTPSTEVSASWSHKAEFTDSETKGWLDVGAPRAANASAWVALWPRPLGNQRFTRPTVFLSSPTSSQLDVVNVNLTATALYGWNTEKGLIYFQAAPSRHPEQRHVFSINDRGTPNLQCLSCSLVQPYDDGTACLYASASFSTDLSRAAFTCTGPGPAAVRLATVTTAGATWQHYLEANSELIEKLKKRKLPTVVGNITLAVEGGIIAQARMWLPPELDTSARNRYPMIVYVYGGPGSQQVSESFSVNWGTFLTTDRGFIYASIDGRGSGYQGSNTLYALYKRLGTVEVLDQIAMTKELIRQFPYIDPTRVGIWGWSYGGYATAMAMALDGGGTFRCGASVAPVTSWDLYDSIYTERYMDLPTKNTDGYKNANISNKIDNFARHDFYLLHGNADDNVHYQQSMRLARALEEKNIFFMTQSYPDENHSIRSVVQHVYMSMTVFFEDCLAPLNSASAMTVLPALLFFPLLARILA